jgi:hypothetical protein
VDVTICACPLTNSTLLAPCASACDGKSNGAKGGTDHRKSVGHGPPWRGHLPHWLSVRNDGRDLIARPLRDRRARLEDVVAGSELVFPCDGSRPMA